MNSAKFRYLFLGSLAVVGLVVLPAPAFETPGESAGYFRDIRPIFQAHCQGCHHPAKAKGGYIMTQFDKLLAGGESGERAIVPGQPDKSALLRMIQSSGQEAEMPKGKPPLSQSQVALIARWIAQGARDDTPPSARIVYDREHPPVYSQLPVLTRLDFSPDGSLLAVAGYHETLLHKSDGSGLAARLVGSSPRIDGLRFSPDGKLLAVAGGRPGMEGELQIWQVSTGKLQRSLSVTFDTLAGPSWSPDGKLVAFGCSDKSVRAIEVATGKQVLYQSTHEDRVLDTVFSAQGTHVVSVSSDTTAKLTELATQRFIDNITSITPGVLKGGIASVARHPAGDVILIGGADGEPKLYHIHRQTARVIGDDANLIRKLPPLRGRVNAVAISRDGRRFCAVSSLDGTGHLRTYEVPIDWKVPPEILAIQRKQMSERSQTELKQIDAYVTRGVKSLADVQVPDAGLYTTCFSPDGTFVAAAGTNGKIRYFDSATGARMKEFNAVPIATGLAARAEARPLGVRKSASVNPEPLAAAGRVVALDVEPKTARIERPYDTIQFVVTARFENGETADVTRVAKKEVTGPALAMSATGLASAQAQGRADVCFSYEGRSATAAVAVECRPAEFHPDFTRDVAPVLSRLGCNSGTCHGANKGKGGFKLSLRGNDPAFDVRAYVDELASRRINFASPDDSLMLLKASAGVPHEGGQLTAPGDAYYELLRAWIAQGARFDSGSPRVAKIDIHPRNPLVQRIGARQQFRVLATYTNGVERDVTAEAFLESGNIEVARVDAGGLVTTLRRGEASVLARFEGAYGATPLIVMGDRDGFVWQDPPANNFIDALVAAKWKRTKTAPSELCTDAEFVRRVYLDLIGLPPTAEDVRRFLADGRDTRVKRDELIERLVGCPDFVEHWTNKWADLLQVNRKYLGVEGAVAFRAWIRDQVARNVPYDRFAREILTACGSNRQNPAASFFKIHRTPEDAMETTTHLFLGVRFSCNKCHDHPFERWTQDQYWETAAFYARVDRKKDPASGDRTIEGTAVEGATPLFEEIGNRAEGEVVHDRTGKIVQPKFPYPAATQSAAGKSRRDQLAGWITTPDNRNFARSFSNRLWAYLLGVGLIEPLDDIRAGNPPTNPELLDRLTQEFVAGGFDVRHLLRTICKSRTYQLSISTNKWNVDDTINYSHALARRLPAEVMFDAIHRVTGSTPDVPGVPRGTRAAQFLDPAVNPAGGFLTQFGRPPRESPCECERSSGMQFGPVMALVSGPTVGNAISDPRNKLAELAASQPDTDALIKEVFFRILNRTATDEEVARSRELFADVCKDHEKLTASLRAAEAAFAPTLARREEQRRAAIAKARAELAAREKALAPVEAERERQHAAALVRAEDELRKYYGSLPASLTAWEARSDKLTSWTPLDPKELSSTSAATLRRENDLSVLAINSNGLGTYKIVAHTDVKAVTAVRLEVLADARHPKKGPGRAPDGNFVLSEFEVRAGPRNAPAREARVGLCNPRADFSQAGFDVAGAIDGQRKPDAGGWAVAPQVGVDHQACFEFKTPVCNQEGTTFTFFVHQDFQSGEHSIGRFRISVTTAAGPLLLGPLPEAISRILNTPGSRRCAEDVKTLQAFYRSIDPEYRARQDTLAAARRPRPVDPTLQSLRKKLDQALLPVPIDPGLQQLRDDLALSTSQLANARLIAVQDLAWGLINSPAFLFNR